MVVWKFSLSEPWAWRQVEILVASLFQSEKVTTGSERATLAATETLLTVVVYSNVYTSSTTTAYT